MFSIIEKLFKRLERLILTLEKNRFGALMFGILCVTLVTLFGLYVYLETASKAA